MCADKPQGKVLGTELPDFRELLEPTVRAGCRQYSMIFLVYG